MSNDDWRALVERVLRTLGEVSPDDITSAEFRVRPHALAAPNDDGSAPAPNDGRPKVFTLTVTTSG